MNVGNAQGYEYVQGTEQGSTVSTGYAGSWYDQPVSAPLTAGLISPWGVSFDTAASVLLVSDGNVIRKVNFQAGSPINIVTVAGGAVKGVPGIASNDAPYHWKVPTPARNVELPLPGNTNAVGTSASFDSPSNIVAVPATRMLYIADSSNNLIRQMTYP